MQAPEAKYEGSIAVAPCVPVTLVAPVFALFVTRASRALATTLVARVTTMTTGTMTIIRDLVRLLGGPGARGLGEGRLIDTVQGLTRFSQSAGRHLGLHCVIPIKAVVDRRSIGRPRLR
jgi:hypothetical protein